MADVEKRYFGKPWMIHNDTKLIKQRIYHAHLSHLKPIGDHDLRAKNPLPHQCRRHNSSILPPISRSTSSGSSLAMAPLIPPPITHVEPIPPINTNNTTLHEEAQRFIPRNNISQVSQESSSVQVSHSAHPKRTKLYKHVQAKINTGLARTNSILPIEPATYQLEPLRPVNWLGLKNEIEHDLHIRTHTKRMQFNSSILYAAQLATLGNLVRSKVKSHLSSATGSGDERYKIVVHLTIFPTIAAGLHVASRCLWNTDTDNSITIKMQGVDCDILIVVFLCYTEL
ncbi:unnamed protein product [Adineta steineri]|uniref:Uncharacterized protein n=1 Tax=Adineta steineri TaxID=433720 RepID=A0A818MF63_9BILA|nr:unnamed protein product [Adineta steineri]CAF3587105.1 unnamed protein product [Adineta steineri]